MLILTFEDSEEEILNHIISCVNTGARAFQVIENAKTNLSFNGLEIDNINRLVRKQKQEIDLTFTEFEILYLLANNLVESALYPLETCGENLISDINNVLWVSACKGVFYIKKYFFKTVSGVRRWLYIHSCYGVKGRYFTLLQVVTEGGDLL